MSRVSARFIIHKFGMSDVKWLYSIWKEMGLVMKDNFGDWTLTNLGRNIGGKMSHSSHLPVPTFDEDVIIKLTKEFLKNRKDS